jgi:molecular chaperone GrpE
MSKKNRAEEMEEVYSEETPNENRQRTVEDKVGEEGPDMEGTGSEGETPVGKSLESELAKEKDKFLRLFADFENYKRRTSKERIELFRTAGQEVIVSLLPVMDDFDRAMKELAKSDDMEMFKGVELIRTKFKEVLKGKGLQEMEVSEGDTFDAEVHDAITQIPAPNEELKGKILDVIEKGFTLGDKIVRHPKVVVGN